MTTDKLTIASKFLTIILMFIGGSPAGTAGGVKTTTMGVLFLTIISDIRGKEDTEIFYKRISRSIYRRSLVTVALAITIIVVITMILTITEVGNSSLDIFFEVTSAFGTVGLSLGTTTDLSNIGKILIPFTMFAGRVGPLAIVLALRKQQLDNRGNYKYPEEKVIVG